MLLEMGLPSPTFSFPTMGGRVVIAQFVLSDTPTYMMQGYILPTRILNNLDKVNCNFVWGSTEEKKKNAYGLLGKNY